MGEPERADSGHGGSEPLDEASGEGGRAAHRDLLSEYGAHAHLEGVDRARYPYAAARPHQRSQRPVAREGRVDDGGLGVEIEQPAHTREEMHQPVEPWQVHAQAQRAAFGLVPHLDHPGRAPSSTTLR